MILTATCVEQDSQGFPAVSVPISWFERLEPGECVADRSSEHAPILAMSRG